MSEEIVAHTYNKELWGRGPWDNEPDRLEWVHAGFACLAVRSSLGTWCGYVGVGEGHPAFGSKYDEVDVSVHGGLTYAAECQGVVCHVPQPGMPDKVWWFGFDCGHAGDTIPSMCGPQYRHAVGPGMDDVFGLRAAYRDAQYIQEETNRLAQQLRAIKGFKP